MLKHHLAAPGPTPVPDVVLLEMAKPIIHHRTKEFEKVMEEARKGLKWIFQTKQEVLMLAGTGTAAMEASLVNCFSPGDTVLCVVSGKFGERWSEMAQKMGLNVVDVEVEWGKGLDLKLIEAAVAKNPGVKGVLTQACETSTGVQHDIQSLAKFCGDKNVLLLVDAITALGIGELPMDKWGIDVLITGSQKAFMLPPGLSMIALSEKAWKAEASAKLPRFYFDLRAEKAAHLKNQTHFTPAVSLIRGLLKSLEMMQTEGLEQIFSRHTLLAKATRSACTALGLKLFAPAGVQANSITSVCAPTGVDGEKIVSHIQEKYGVTIIGGQDDLKGKIFRLGHMGYCAELDVITMIAALERTLLDLGHKFELGAGLAAAQKTFANKN